MRHQLARKPAGILDDDGAHAVALDAVEKLREARPILDRVRSRNSRVEKLGDDLEAAPLGEALDGLPLQQRKMTRPLLRRRCPWINRSKLST